MNRKKMFVFVFVVVVVLCGEVSSLQAQAYTVNKPSAEADFNLHGFMEWFWPKLTATITVPDPIPLINFQAGGASGGCARDSSYVNVGFSPNHIPQDKNNFSEGAFISLEREVLGAFIACAGLPNGDLGSFIYEGGASASISILLCNSPGGLCLSPVQVGGVFNQMSPLVMGAPGSIYIRDFQDIGTATWLRLASNLTGGNLKAYTAALLRDRPKTWEQFKTMLDKVFPPVGDMNFAKWFELNVPVAAQNIPDGEAMGGYCSKTIPIIQPQTGLGFTAINPRYCVVQFIKRTGFTISVVKDPVRFGVKAWQKGRLVDLYTGTSTLFGLGFDGVDVRQFMGDPKVSDSRIFWACVDKNGNCDPDRPSFQNVLINSNLPNPEAGGTLYLASTKPLTLVGNYPGAQVSCLNESLCVITGLQPGLATITDGEIVRTFIVDKDTQVQDVFRPSVPSVAQAVVSAADGQGSGVLVPGSIVSLYGSFFALYPAGAGSLPLPTKLGSKSPLNYCGDTQVNFIPSNGQKIPGALFYIGPIQVNVQDQINVQVPWELLPNDLVKVQVIGCNGGVSNTLTARTQSSSPGMFVAVFPDGSPVTPDNPAKPGDVIVVYATGLGAVSNPPKTGWPALASPLSETLQACEVLLDGVLLQNDFCGLTPNLVGLYQLNVRIPEQQDGGDNKAVRDPTRFLTIRVGNSISPPLALAVQ